MIIGQEVEPLVHAREIFLPEKGTVLDITPKTTLERIGAEDLHLVAYEVYG